MLDPKEQAKQGFGAHVARERERKELHETGKPAEASAAGTPLADASSATAAPASETVDATQAAAPGQPSAARTDGSR